MSANLSVSVGLNLSPVDGVKVVTGGRLIVAVEWQRTINLVLVDVALHSLRSVSILSNLTICCGSYLVAVCRVYRNGPRSLRSSSGRVEFWHMHRDRQPALYIARQR